jgi:hypothetical protein
MPVRTAVPGRPRRDGSGGGPRRAPRTGLSRWLGRLLAVEHNDLPLFIKQLGEYDKRAISHNFKPTIADVLSDSSWRHIKTINAVILC